jgi:hypothetical protein
MFSGNIYIFCVVFLNCNPGLLLDLLCSEGKEVIPIQVLLWTLAFIFCIFFFAYLFILVCPCRYYIEGNRHKNFEGILIVKVAFLKMRLKITETDNYQGGLYVWKWKLINVQKQDLGEVKKNTHSKEKRATRPVKRRTARLTFHKFSTWLGELDRTKFNLILELSRKIYQEMRPQKLLFKGKLGFANPYYTGLLAAGLFCFSIEKVNIEPIFFEPVCELTIQLKGRINLGLLCYYSLYFLMICPLRVILWENSKNKREEKGYGL